MDARNWIGLLAETTVAAKLVEQGYYVFQQIAGVSPFDLAAYKDGKFYRVSVKGTATKKDKASYVITLERTRATSRGLEKRSFDASVCDVIAAYIHEERAVCFIRSSDVDGKRRVRFCPKRHAMCRSDQRPYVMDECFNFGSVAE